MSRSEELAAKAARLKQQQQDRDSRTSVPTEVRPPAEIRVRPVRLTLDVSPADHTALARWSLDASAELGRARVAGQELMRALLRRALADPELRRLVVEDIATAPPA